MWVIHVQLKNCDFRQTTHHISETVQDRNIATMEDEYEVCQTVTLPMTFSDLNQPKPSLTEILDQI